MRKVEVIKKFASNRPCLGRVTILINSNGFSGCGPGLDKSQLFRIIGLAYV